MKPKIVSRFEYKELERVTHEDGARYYVDPTGAKLSSVTTILSATSYKPQLEEWKAWVGEKEAKRIVTEACNLGTLMHTHLENYVQDIPRPGGNNLIRVMSRNMADQIIDHGLKNVDEVWGLETMLYYPEAYAGTTDLVGLHEGVESIMDYKTSRKMKSRDMIDDYFCQMSAYALAHDELYGTKMKKGVIFMVDRDLKYKEFVIEGNEFAKYKDLWLTKLEVFLNLKANVSQP